MRQELITSLLLTAIFGLTDVEPEKAKAQADKTTATTPATVKLTATPRAGYALVSAEATGGQLKQVEFVVTANGTTSDISYDQAGTVLVVSLPQVGTVTVWAVALLADGTLAQPVSTDLAAPKPTAPSPTNPTPSAPPMANGNPLQTEKNLRVILAVNLANPGKPEQDLILYGSPTAQSIKQALAGLGHTWHVADVNATVFQQALTLAKQANPSLTLTAADAPFLWIERADRTFVAGVRLQLGPDAQKNAQALFALFQPKP